MVLRLWEGEKSSRRVGDVCVEVMRKGLGGECGLEREKRGVKIVGWWFKR